MSCGRRVSAQSLLVACTKSRTSECSIVVLGGANSNHGVFVRVYDETASALRLFVSGKYAELLSHVPLCALQSRSRRLEHGLCSESYTQM